MNWPKNLRMFTTINKIQWKLAVNSIQYQIEFNKLKEEYKSYRQVYTDGSKKHHTCGIGIYTENDTNISVKLEQEASIKTTELIAIYLALNNELKKNNKKIIIFTDSKSSCTSLENCVKKEKLKFYENKIVQLLNENKKLELVIQWIPAHVGIKGNEEADKLAKSAIEAENCDIFNNHIPIEDIYGTIKNNIETKWKQEYEVATRSKGAFNRTINNEAPPKENWFKSVNMNTRYIKIINRLRTGHTYNKIFKHRMGLEATDECNLCNVRETDLHLFDNCPRFRQLKSKYNNIKDKGITDILKEGKRQELIELAKFYIEANIEY